jgi:hypothetical protein
VASALPTTPATCRNFLFPAIRSLSADCCQRASAHITLCQTSALLVCGRRVCECGGGRRGWARAVPNLLDDEHYEFLQLEAEARVASVAVTRLAFSPAAGSLHRPDSNPRGRRSHQDGSTAAVHEPTRAELQTPLRRLRSAFCVSAYLPSGVLSAGRAGARLTPSTGIVPSLDRCLGH